MYRIDEYIATGLKGMRQAVAIFLFSALLALLVNALRPDGLAWVGDWTPQAQLALNTGENLMISLPEAEAFYYAEAALMLDARSPEEYAAGHIAGARNLPWEQFDAHMNEVIQEVYREDLIITYCDGESCNLSQEVALALMDRGYTNVRVLVNGWTLWQANSLPVATGPER